MKIRHLGALCTECVQKKKKEAYIPFEQATHVLANPCIYHYFHKVSKNSEIDRFEYITCFYLKIFKHIRVEFRFEIKNTFGVSTIRELKISVINTLTISIVGYKMFNVCNFLFQAKLLESSHAWLGASTSSIAGKCQWLPSRQPHLYYSY